MLRVDLMQAKPGMRLALPVHNPKAVTRVLLTAGFDLTDAAIQSLRDMAVRSVWVAYPSLAAIDQYVNAESLKVQQELAGRIADVFEDTQDKATAKLDYEHYRASITGMIQHVVTHPKAAVFIGELAEASNDLIRHASTVTYLAVLMGLKLEGYMVRERKHINPAKAKEITNLGVGAMLHDFGLTLLDPEVLERHQREGNEADKAYQEHCALGFRALRGQIDPSAATILLHHHQRFDGSGFAGADFPVQSGHAIHVYARIVAVADQFDRMRRPANLPEQPTVAVLSAMRSPSMRKRFDTEVLRALIEVVPPYAPGLPLRLSDGRGAVAVDHNPGNPCRPVVQIIPELQAMGDAAQGATLNLADAPPTLWVAECDGKPVSEFNFAGDAAAQAA